MELIIPHANIWEQNNSLDGIWAHIARCTRVCYQSTPKENGETNEEFVKRVILHSPTGEVEDFDAVHGAMLEHGTVYLAIPITTNHSGSSELRYLNNKYSIVNESVGLSMKDEYGDSCDCWCITTNLRVLYENNWLDDLEYICSPTEYHTRRVTACFTTNIGVTREFNRHRVNSIAEESTRYCNYSRRNSGQLKIGLPAWLLDDEHLPYINSHQWDSISEYAEEILAYEDETLLRDWSAIDFYLCSITFAQWCYNMLIKKGWKPQQAREVLPLATKSQLIHTAFIADWKHFIKLRAEGVSGRPHPNAKLIADSLKTQLIEAGYIEE